MRRKIIILAVMALFLTSSVGYAASAGNVASTHLALEKVEYSAATVTVGKLNVREGPSTSFPSICKLEKGQAVTVIGKLGDWYAIYNIDNGVVGAVDGRYISLEGDKAITVASKTDVPAEAVNTVKPEDKTSGKAAPAKDPVPATKKTNLSQDEQKLLELVNDVRKKEGLEQLTADENLMKVARTKAKDMIENNYFSHQSPTYGSPFDMMRQFENTFRFAGENIAGNKTVEGAFKAWMASDSHKKNILNSGFKITGIGIENSSTYGKILVQQFIGR